MEILSQYRLDALKEILKRHKLPLKGTKPQLIQRILAEGIPFKFEYKYLLLSEIKSRLKAQDLPQELPPIPKGDRFEYLNKDKYLEALARILEDFDQISKEEGQDSARAQILKGVEEKKNKLRTEIWQEHHPDPPEIGTRLVWNESDCFQEEYHFGEVISSNKVEEVQIQRETLQGNGSGSCTLISPDWDQTLKPRKLVYLNFTWTISRHSVQVYDPNRGYYHNIYY